jgi:hypothetical protein
MPQQLSALLMQRLCHRANNTPDVRTHESSAKGCLISHTSVCLLAYVHHIAGTCEEVTDWL